jgi:transposase-like protein
MFNKEKSVDYHTEQRTETTLSNKSTPEVKPKRTNRRFSASYKLKVLEEMDRATVSGQKGAILRREGLYTSQIAGWRKQRADGALSALSKVRGRKKQSNEATEQVNSLEKENADLKRKLKEAEAIIDIQKKVSEIFGIRNPSEPKNEATS